MTAEYQALEDSVSTLEHQVRDELRPEIHAVSFGVSVLHREMTEQFGEVQERLGRLELGQERQGERLGRLELGQERQGERMDRHGEMLTEILRRLPRPAGDPEEG